MFCDPFYKMSKSLEFRNDIQALRAISALIIVICHIWLNKVSGGVDVFFVVSGFFMAATLVKLDNNKRYEIYFIFWRKVLTKIFPTTILIVLTTTLIAYLINYPQRYEIIRSGLLSILNLENLNLILLQSNYLDNSTKSVFQHFWALSIQLQFYLLYPLIFIFINQRKILILSSITLISFAYSIYMVNSDPSAAYYHPLARLWEFTVGGLAFLLYKNNITIKQGYIAALSFLGFITFAFFYPKNFNFPGFSSLLPVLFATLILLNTGKNSIISYLSKNSFLKFISKFSFTLYLVHWPILIFTKYVTFSNTVNFSNGVIIIIASIIISYLVHKFFEKKITYNLNKLNLIYFFILISLIILATIAIYTTLYLKNKNMEKKSLELLENNSLSTNRLKDNILSIRVLGVSKISRDECMSSTDEVQTCIWGDTTADQSIALVGGSHIEQWLPIFDKYGKQNSFQVIQITKADCPLGGSEYSPKDCLTWTDKAINYIAEKNTIKYIVTNSTRTYDHDNAENVPKGYSSSFLKLKQASSAKLIGIRDNTRFKIDPNLCLANNLKNPEKCNYRLNRHLAIEDPSVQYKDLITSIDFSDLYCPSTESCDFHEQNIPIFLDTNHLSFIYVDMIADQGIRILENVMPSQ